MNFDHADEVSTRNCIAKTAVALSANGLVLVAAIKNRSVGVDTLRRIIIIMNPRTPRGLPWSPSMRGWNTKQSAFPVSGMNVSIYGRRLPAPTSYDIVSVGSRNLRDRWLG